MFEASLLEALASNMSHVAAAELAGCVSESVQGWWLVRTSRHVWRSVGQ